MKRIKLIKQGYFDYTSTQNINVSVYVDGSAIPYHEFVLPPQPDRLVVRVLFPAQLCRLWRLIALSTGDFQFWANPTIEWKPIEEGSGYAIYQLNANL